MTAGKAREKRPGNEVDVRAEYNDGELKLNVNNHT